MPKPAAKQPTTDQLSAIMTRMSQGRDTWVKMTIAVNKVKPEHRTKIADVLWRLAPAGCAEHRTIATSTDRIAHTFLTILTSADISGDFELEAQKALEAVKNIKTPYAVKVTWENEPTYEMMSIAELEALG